MSENVVITVQDSSIEAVESALRRLKKRMISHGVLSEMRRHEAHVKPSVVKREKSIRARKRLRKAAKRVAVAEREQAIRRYGTAD